MERSAHLDATLDGARAPGPRAAPPDYSMRLTSKLTGIEPDTLRVWERRYGFPKPRRSAAGSRVYSRADVQSLQLVVRALKAGYRAGEVVGKTARELGRLIDAASIGEPESVSSPSLDAMFRALLRDDVVTLRSELRRAGAMLGPLQFVTQFAHPASVRVGSAWAEGKLEVRHEHLFSASLSRQLHVMLAAFDENMRGHKVLLATLPNEAHGLGLDMIALYIAAHGMVPRVLGIHTPADQILAAAHAYDCDVVGLSVTAASSAVEASAHIHSLVRHLPRRIQLWVGGAGANNLALDRSEREAIVLAPDFPSLELAIAGLGKKARRAKA